MRYVFALGLLFLVACSNPPSEDKVLESIPEGDNPPTLVPVSPQVYEEEEAFGIQLEVTQEVEEKIVYKLDNPPEGSSFDEEVGYFLWRPEVGQAGVYSLKFRALAKGGVSHIRVSVSIQEKPDEAEKYPDLITLPKTTFTEGEFGEKLIRLNFNAHKKVERVTVENFNKVFTIVSNMAGESVYAQRIHESGVISFIIPREGQFYTELKGGVKEAGTYTLDFRVSFTSGESITKVFEIKVLPSNLPTFRYNLINSTKDNSASFTHFKVSEQIETMNKILEGHMRPILDTYEEKEVVCEGEPIIDFVSSNHKECLLDYISPTSETVFLFDSTMSRNRVGGISYGARKGAVVSNSSHDHTLIHELGHNFGLPHTFETMALRVNHNQGVSNWILWEGSTNWNYEIAYSIDTDRFGFQPGDNIDDTPFDPYGSKYYQSVNGGTAFHISWNGDYEGSEQFLYDSVQGHSNMFVDSEYACKQVFNPSTHSYDFDCETHTDLMDPGVITNIMSYWYKISGQESITQGQVDKMLEVIGIYPEIR